MDVWGKSYTAKHLFIIQSQQLKGQSFKLPHLYYLTTVSYYKAWVLLGQEYFYKLALAVTFTVQVNYTY